MPASRASRYLIRYGCRLWLTGAAVAAWRIGSLAWLVDLASGLAAEGPTMSDRTALQASNALLNVLVTDAPPAVVDSKLICALVEWQESIEGETAPPLDQPDVID